MAKVLFMQGLPASGKTTWSKDFCEKNSQWIRVSRDDLRSMRGKYWIPKQESLITLLEYNCILIALQQGYNVVVDATNLNKSRLTSLKKSISTIFPDVIYESKFFDISVEECIKRDLNRPLSVGEDVIKNMAKLLEPDRNDYKQNKTLPKIIIVDLDGTVAIHNGRSPYDVNNCDKDLPNKPIIKIVENYLSYGHGDVVFMSGRDDCCYNKTVEWIKKYIQIGEKEFKLYMRKTGDRRKDYIVKKELFDKHIRDIYYVDFILDDRTQVVSLWRSLGLTCLQVADGNF